MVYFRTATIIFRYPFFSFNNKVGVTRMAWSGLHYKIIEKTITDNPKGQDSKQEPNWFSALSSANTLKLHDRGRIANV